MGEGPRRAGNRTHPVRALAENGFKQGQTKHPTPKLGINIKKVYRKTKSLICTVEIFSDGNFSRRL